MVQHSEGGAGIRRAAVGSVTALLVLSGAMGAAVAGLPHGKKVTKPPAGGKVFGQKPIPPATAGDDGTGNDLAPLPGADGPTDAPPLTSPKSPRAAQTPAPTGSSSAGTGGGSPSGGSPSSSGDSGKKANEDKAKDHKKPKPKGPTLFTRGAPPASADIWSGGKQTSGDDLYRVFDSDAGSAWPTKKSGVGVVVGSNGGTTKAVGLVSRTAGYEVYLYSSNADDPPSDLADWKQTGSVSNAEGKQKLDVFGNQRDAKYYLLRFTSLPSGGRLKLGEIQLIQ
jgi:hypothetical protein